MVGRVLFKFGVGEEYVRDGVMPSYDWSRVPLAFYTYFRSDRQGVLFHPLGGGADWLPDGGLGRDVEALVRGVDRAPVSDDVRTRRCHLPAKSWGGTNRSAG